MNGETAEKAMQHLKNLCIEDVIYNLEVHNNVGDWAIAIRKWLQELFQD